MLNQVLLYLGAALPLFWGIAHLFPTKSVVAGFGDITLDNQRIITMEWIVEGVSLIFIGTLVAVVTYMDYTSGTSRAVYWISFIALNTLSGPQLGCASRRSAAMAARCGADADVP